METPQVPRPWVGAGRRTRLVPMFLLVVLAALAACSPSGTRNPTVVTISAVESGDVQAQFHVRAQPAPATDLMVSVTIAADGCDLTRPLESVTIAAGDDQAVVHGADDRP